MLILGVHSGYHEASACLFDDYRMVAAVALERMTRRKVDGGRIPEEAIDECLAIGGADRRRVDALVLGRGPFPWRFYNHFTGGRLAEGLVRQALGREKHKSMERELTRVRRSDSEAIFRADAFLAAEGFRPDCRLRFFNHHYAHALPTLFHTAWEDALLYTADGGGDNVQYSHRVFRDGRIETLYGGDEELARPMRIDSLGLAYGYATQALGFRINRHEGKLTGLAAYGKSTAFERIAAHFKVDEAGQVQSGFTTNAALRSFMFEVAGSVSREDMAASIQAVLEHFILESVKQLLARHPVRHLGLSGGVFANVRLNQRLAEETGVDDVFVYPAMGDQGLPAGGVLQFLLERDGLAAWLARRRPLDHLYFGRDYTATADAVLAATPGLRKISDEPVNETAALCAAGKVVGLYTNGMEYGPRALGARSILASPSNHAINDTLNQRLARSEFMPFAPVVAAEDADTVFHLPAGSRYAARFMTITCAVRDEWRDRIPAVVHVDGTARPQLIERAPNPTYYDIVARFKALTGLPVMINTSFNVHEEPIINTPAECTKALLDDRIDYVATARAVYARG
ncbi:MAG: carbamoyltransferase C-terminal domain-containing protein [Alphaproteobacteria bacterium]